MPTQELQESRNRITLIGFVSGANELSSEILWLGIGPALARFGIGWLSRLRSGMPTLKT